MNLILIGFMGAGKSTVAKLLGATIETDALVLEKTGTKTMQEVFAKGGERLLRETEMIIAKELAQANNCIISTGGGFPSHLLVGIKVFLRAELTTIKNRLQHDTTRPLLANLETLYKERAPLYTRIADIIIDVDDITAEEVAWQLTHLVKSFASQPLGSLTAPLSVL